MTQRASPLTSVYESHRLVKLLFVILPEDGVCSKKDVDWAIVSSARWEMMSAASVRFSELGSFGCGLLGCNLLFLRWEGAAAAGRTQRMEGLTMRHLQTDRGEWVGGNRAIRGQPLLLSFFLSIFVSLFLPFFLSFFVSLFLS